MGKKLAGPVYEGIEREGDEKDSLCEKDEKEDIAADVYSQPLLSVDYPGSIHQVERRAADDDGGTFSRLSLKAVRGSPLLAGWMRYFPTTSDMVEDTSQPAGTPRRDSCRSSHRREGADDSPFTDHASPAPTTFSSVATSDDDDEEYDAARRLVGRRTAIRQKSLRKRIAERWFGSKRERCEATPRTGRRGTTPEMEDGVLDYYSGDAENSPSTIKRNVLKTPSTHGRALSDYTIPIDPLRTPPRAVSPNCVGTDSPRRSLRGAFNYFVQLKDPGVVEDRYTPLPERSPRPRRKLVSARSVRRRSENVEMKEDAESERSLSQARDRSFLPTSPPLLSSQRLNSELFFSPPHSQNSILNPSMSTTMTRPHDEIYRVSSPPPSRPVLCDSPSRRTPQGPRVAKKLLSVHSARHINIPYPDEDPTDRDKALPPSPTRRITTRSSSSSPSKAHSGSRASNVSLRRERSNTAPSAPTPMSPKERYEARRTVLSRVDEIVSRSYSARFEQGVDTPQDPRPTMQADYLRRTNIYGEAGDDGAGRGVGQMLDGT